MKFFKSSFFTILVCAGVCVSNMQGQTQKKSFTFQRQGVADFSANLPDLRPTLLIKEMPKQGSKKMVQYNYPASNGVIPAARPSGSLAGLVLGLNHFGNPFSVSTPCDNDLAISDSGFVVSTMNTNIYFKNENTGQTYPNKSLSVFTTPINNKHQEFDPKVIYDPQADRYVLMCLVGFVDTTSKVIVGFSQTNNPTGAWNLYTLPGDALNNGLWTDYPMISLSNKDLFLSVNLLYNDSSWQTGFVETIVWQMKKSDGYSGQALTSDLHFNIKYNGKAIRNLCPAKGGSQLYGPNMYFVSNRNLASQNDTVFVVNITDTTGAPGNSVTTKALVTNQPYYFPPDGIQPLATQSLAANDARNLGAFYENNKIQYVHNTRNPANGRVTVYHGIIDNPGAATASVTGYLLDNDTLCFAYPNISYSSITGTDNIATITFDHSSSKINPGVSAIQSDGEGNYSDILRIKSGSQPVNLLNSNLERWGDYSGSQRRYNRPGEIWMSGYWGYGFSVSYPQAHGAWIAQLTPSMVPVVIDETGLQKQKEAQLDLSIYPNPTTDLFKIDFHLNRPEYLTFELIDQRGRVVYVLLRDWVKTTDNTFSFNAHDYLKGSYQLRIRGNYGTNITKKIILD